MSDSHDRKRVRKRRSLGAMINAQQRETSLLGILRDEPRFRWALGGMVLLLLGLGGLLPKLWITSPKDFDPVVKISGLDYLQAASLRRAAVRHTDAGEIPEAVQAWSAAFANNLGDADTVRGILRLVTTANRVEPRWIGAALQQSQWLLRLTQTNQADLELVCTLYQRQDMHETVVRFLGDTNRQLTPAGVKLMVPSLFEAGHMERFGRFWDSHKDQVEAEPQLRLYRDAWGAAWGPPSGLQGSARALAEAITKPDLSTNALRLQLAVQSQRLDSQGFEQTFTQLQALRADRLTDHIRYWLLLDFLGKRPMAIDRARAYVTPPQNALEAETLLRAWARLGLFDLAVEFEPQMANFQGSTQLWLVLSRMLIAAQKWDELRSVALALRNNHRVNRSLNGYSYFLEGVAEHGAGLAPRAEAAFRQLLGSPPEDATMTFEAASVIQRLGYAEPARELYRRLEKDMGDRLQFWQQMAQAAHETHDAALLVAACEKAHLLAPNNALLANNHAAALLISRTNAPEALKLTLAVLSKSPDSKTARINHALALAQVGRFDDSERALSTLQPSLLSEVEQSFYHFARLECAAGRNDLEGIRKEIDQIQLRYLFPSQTDWLSTLRARLNPEAPAAPEAAPTPQAPPA